MSWPDDPFEPCPVAFTVDHGDRIALGDCEFLVHHLPGHTWDGMALQLGRDYFAIAPILPLGSAGWCDAHWGSNFLDYLESLELLRSFLPCRVFPSHGPPFQLTAEMLDKTAENIRLIAQAEFGGNLDAPGKRAPRRDPSQQPRVIRL
jgi:glyoxylase-like metal-dependent hydrolase (beta-lactamase superfamily II)